MAYYQVRLGRLVRAAPRMRLIGIFRHPTAVARSLEARGGMPQEKALFLWRHYNGRMLELHRGAPFPLLCFDDSEAVLHAHLNAEFVKLGLCPLEDERFWAAELRHHEVNAEPVPDSCAELYRELRSRAC